jgi:hypothetical protein
MSMKLTINLHVVTHGIDVYLCKTEDEMNFMKSQVYEGDRDDEYWNWDLRQIEYEA